MKAILVTAVGYQDNPDDPYYEEHVSLVVCVATTREAALREARQWLTKRHASLLDWGGECELDLDKLHVHGGERGYYETLDIQFEDITLVA